MRLTGSRAYYRPSPPKMPPGLVELMEGLTREVLKHNPSDVYGFCASHMHQLLEKRDGPSLKKPLPLEEKIARAQEKIRLRAEIRRQEYDKNIMQLQNYGNAINDKVKDITEQVPQSPAVVPEGVSVILNNDALKSSVHDVTQNIINPPVHHDQALENSGEMEISQSGLEVSKPEDSVTKSKDDEEANMKTNDSVNEEKCENVVVTESNYEPSGNIVVNDISSNAEPCTETVNKQLTNEIISDISKSPDVSDLRNENQQHEFNTNDAPLDFTDTIIKIEEKVENNAEVIAAEHEIVNTSVEIGGNLSESSTDDLKKSENLNNTENAKIQNVQPSSLVEAIHDSDPSINNVEQFQHTEKNLLATRVEHVQHSIDAANTQAASDILKIDSHKDDVQNVNDAPGALQLDNTDSNDFLPENTCKTSSVSPSEKNTQPKCDDDLPTVNSTPNDDVCNEQENIENSRMNLHDITEIKTPVLEKGVDIDFHTTGVDSDIRTLVTENSGNDTNEIKVSEHDTLQTATSLDNMSEVYNENVNDADTENISTYKNNVDTTQDESNVNETKAENQGTNHMDLETAAVTIQKVFRNFLFKSRGSTFEDTANDEGNFLDDDKNKEECDFSIANAINLDRRAHGLTRMDTVLQTVNEEKSLSLSTDDSSTLSSAATIIQAHVRGFLVRNKMNSNKTISTNSLAASHSNEPFITSIETNNGSDQNKNKTILNIHIVPEGENYLSRDESLITSMDLSLDSSPPSSINLHPLGYDKSERRKQLKREDAIQSISPPSNNSGKLSEDFDSVKELPLNDQHDVTEHILRDNITANGHLAIENGHIQTSVVNGSLEIISKGNDIVDNHENNTNDPQKHLKMKRESLSKMSSDEMDVVTPYMSHEDLTSSNLMHSGEFHDAVLPTRVSRSDTSVVSGE